MRSETTLARMCMAAVTAMAAGWLAGCAALPAGSQSPMDGAKLNADTVRQYEKVEIAWTPDRRPDNPFDPNQVALDGLFELPSGRRVRVPGFWFQDYRRQIANPEATGNDRIETLSPVGEPGWRVRFSSGEVGEHRAVLELRDAGGVRRSGVLRFTVSPGPGGGPIRVSPRNGSFLEDAAGRPFFPIGQNLCMYQRREGTYYYDRLLPKLSRAGGNYIRLWQEYYLPLGEETPANVPGDGTFAGFPLVTLTTGPERYDLESAWRLDYVAGLCEQLGVRWQLTFEMVGWWYSTRPKWRLSHYNAANGGPCAKATDYFTNPAARELVRRRIRYNVARWGWTSHLTAWELWNEVDNMPGFDSELCAAWHREMADYLSRIDPWDHLVTTSWRDRRTFAEPGVDLVQTHSYWRANYDAAEYSLQDTDHLMRGFGKPFFFGEQGLAGPVEIDPAGEHFRNCLWATALSGAAGSGMYWNWHSYIEPYDLYHHYTPLARFLADEDLPARRWQRARTARPTLPVTLRLYGLVADDRALLWIHDPLAWRVVGDKPVVGPAQSDASLNVAGLADGNYEIDWWDTSRGEIIRTDHGRVRRLRHFGHGLELRPPPFQGSIAARVRRVARAAD